MTPMHRLLFLRPLPVTILKKKDNSVQLAPEVSTILFLRKNTIPSVYSGVFLPS